HADLLDRAEASRTGPRNNGGAVLSRALRCSMSRSAPNECSHNTTIPLVSYERTWHFSLLSRQRRGAGSRRRCHCGGPGGAIFTQQAWSEFPKERGTILSRCRGVARQGHRLFRILR